MARVEFRMPGRLHIPTRFFGRLTWKDIVRLALPVILCFLIIDSSPSAATAIWLAAAGLTGILWYSFTPFNQHLDELSTNAIRWYIGQRNIETVQITEKLEDHLLTSNKTVIGVIEVNPANLEMRTEAEQYALISIYRSLFETISYPIEIHSRQENLSLEEYLHNIADNESPDHLLQKDYLEYIHHLDQQAVSQTRHYIVVRVEPEGQKWVEKQLPEQLPFIDRPKDEQEQEILVNELDSRCRDILDTLNTADLSATRLTKKKLWNTSYIPSTYNSQVNPRYTSIPDENGRGDYRRTLSVTEYPASIDAGWTGQILQTSGLVDIVQVVEPRDTSKAVRKLQRLSEKVNAEIDSFLAQGYRGTNKLEGLLDDVEWFLDLLADREDIPVDYGVYITTHSENQAECQQTFEKVCNRLDTMQIDYRKPVFGTDQAYYTDSLFHLDHLQETLLVPAQSAATGFPFTTRNTDLKDGVIYGIDTQDESPALFDRFSWSSHSMARMGMVGSGKSYAAKIELLRAHIAYPDLQIIIADPKNEYRSITRTLDGTTYILDEDKEYSFNEDVVCFQVKERGQEENTDLLVDLVQQIYSVVSQTQRRTLVVIDEARIMMNSEAGRRVFNRFVLEGRDTNTAITLISQNASHFTYCREGREILDNMPGKIFMRHDRVPDSVVDYFRLSQREEQELYELKTGTDSRYSEALFKITGQLDTRIRVESTPQEHALIDGGQE